jgi:hypothetical protein
MTAYKKIFFCIFLLALNIYSCKNAPRDKIQHTTCYDCFELADFDTTVYPISDHFKKPYIAIIETEVTDSGCIYHARTNICIDSVAYNNIILYKRKNEIIGKLTDIESKEFKLFDFNYETNKPHNITINYCDSLTQSFQAIIESKIIMKNNETAYIYRIKDFFYWFHNGYDFTTSADVILFITKKQGIIGSYIEGNDLDGSTCMIGPAGNILSDYIDYTEIKMRYLQ